MTRDRREFVKLDVAYLSNPKVVALLVAHRPNAVLLHVACIGYSRLHRTDGLVPVAAARAQVIGSTTKDVGAAVEVGLLVDRGDGYVEVHDYLEHQESAADIARHSEAGKIGAAARWDGADRTPDRNADRIPDRNAEGEGEGEEREITPNGVSSAAPATPSRTRGCRIPDDFAVTDDMRTWALEQTPDVNPDQWIDDFRDYWSGVSGKAGVKLDWVGTWRNDMRKRQRWASERGVRRPSAPARPYAVQPQEGPRSLWDMVTDVTAQRLEQEANL